MTRRFGLVALAIIISATVAGGMAEIFQKKTAASQSKHGVTASHDVADDYREALQVIGDEYAGDVDYEKATQASIQGMLSTLDPHSIFFPPAEFTKLQEDQDSHLTGIGVTILRHRDGVYIQSAVQGTPAARAGLRYGDRIIEVDGKDARDWTSEQVSKNVRGERGEPVKIKIERAGSQVPFTFTIVRESVPLPSIRNAYMIRPGTGYIGLTGGFQHTTGDELRETISKLKAQGKLSPQEAASARAEAETAAKKANPIAAIRLDNSTSDLQKEEKVSKIIDDELHRCNNPPGGPRLSAAIPTMSPGPPGSPAV